MVEVVAQAGCDVAAAFDVELAHQLDVQVLTLDARPARASTFAVLPDDLEG